MSKNKTVKSELIDMHGRYCWLCGKKFTKDKLTLHHIVPVSKHGETTIVNGMVLCEHCHFDVVNKVIPFSDEYVNLMLKAIHWARNNRKSSK